jgi:hypothetical protein
MTSVNTHTIDLTVQLAGMPALKIYTKARKYVHNK